MANHNAANNLTPEARSKGGKMSGGNFANDREKASRAGKKGGAKSSRSHNKGQITQS